MLAGGSKKLDRAGAAPHGDRGTESRAQDIAPELSRQACQYILQERLGTIDCPCKETSGTECK